jgi:hypothetical protein
MSKNACGVRVRPPTGAVDAEAGIPRLEPWGVSILLPPRLPLSVFQLPVFVQLCAGRERGAAFRALRALWALVRLPLVVP